MRKFSVGYLGGRLSRIPALAGRAFSLAFTVGMSILLPGKAFATGSSIGTVLSSDWTSSGNSLITFLEDAAFLGGVALTAFGISHAVKAHKGKGNEKMSEAFVMILAGAALASVGWVMNVGQGTIFGTGGSNISAPTAMTVN